MQLEQTLRTLCALPAVSGFEMQAAKAVAELFRPYCDTVDADKNGNVIGSLSCGKEGAKTVLLDAHLDQIGFLVTEVLDGGFLRFAPVGGVDPRMLLGGEVTILADEPLYGVVSCMPPHLLKAGEQNKAVPIDQTGDRHRSARCQKPHSRRHADRVRAAADQAGGRSALQQVP